METKETKSTTLTTSTGPTSASSGNGMDLNTSEMDRLASRYGRDAQLAVEGLLYWGLRWPFELMAYSIWLLIERLCSARSS